MYVGVKTSDGGSGQALPSLVSSARQRVVPSFIVHCVLVTRICGDGLSKTKRWSLPKNDWGCIRLDKNKRRQNGLQLTKGHLGDLGDLSLPIAHTHL